LDRRRTAAFYDLDGTLLHGSVVDHYLYYALNDPHYPSRLRRLLEMAVKAPYFKYVDSLDRHQFNQVFYAHYEGLSQDRLAVLGEVLFEKVLKKKLYDGVMELLERDRAVGHMQVLVTGALDFVAQPVAEHLGIETVVPSRLEYNKNGLATGVLKPPVMAGPAKATWIRQFAEENDIDLQRSVAYSDDAADLPMLSMVGRPVAVNPDRQLLATARSHGWPVLYVDAGPKTPFGRLGRGALDAGTWAFKRLRDEAELRAPQARSGLRGLRAQLRNLAAPVLTDRQETSE
jgi:HAD superfamily hydrolase (TIGR01490 family)